MPSRRDTERVQLRNPQPGKSGPRIPKAKYDAVRRAILRAVPKREPGLAFKDLAAEVRARLSAHERETLGSVGWHTTSVKLDLEARGELRRVADARPQHLVRTR